VGETLSPTGSQIRPDSGRIVWVPWRTDSVAGAGRAGLKEGAGGIPAAPSYRPAGSQPGTSPSGASPAGPAALS